MRMSGFALLHVVAGLRRPRCARARRRCRLRRRRSRRPTAPPAAAARRPRASRRAAAAGRAADRAAASGAGRRDRGRCARRITSRPLGVARDLRAQQIELRHASGLALLPHLLGGPLGLRQRLFGNHDQAIAQHRVEVRLRRRRAPAARASRSASAPRSRGRAAPAPAAPAGVRRCRRSAKTRD